MSRPDEGSKSTVPVQIPARKVEPSGAIAVATRSSAPVATASVSMYLGRHDAAIVNGASQSGLVTSQLAKPGAHSAASQRVAPSLQVNNVFASWHDLSPHAPQLTSVPSWVSQPSLPAMQSAYPVAQRTMAHFPTWH